MKTEKSVLAAALFAAAAMICTPVMAEVTDGTYKAAGQGKNGDVEVSVTFKDGKITDVEVGDNQETAGVSDPAIEKIPRAIVENQSILVDTVSGATLTSNAIISAVKDCILQAGGTEDEFSNEAAEEAETEELSTEVIDVDADVAVVGAGGSGSAAAVSASQNGAKVVVLEKTGSVGGSSVMSLGMGAMGSELQKEAGDDDYTAGDWLEAWLEQQNYMVSAPMIYEYITNSGETVDWLVDNGFEFDYVGHFQEALKDDPIGTYHIWSGDGFAENCANMLDTIKNNGGEIYLNTRGTELIMDGDKVAGVVGKEEDGTTVNVHAKAVVIATGGYGASDEKMMDLLGFKANGLNTGAQVGDGIDMGVAVGADTEGIGNVEFHGAHAAFDLASGIGDGTNLNEMAVNPAALWVNSDGYRFTNEDICYDNSYIGNVTSRQGSQYYVLFTQKMLDTLESEGGQGLGLTRDFTAYGGTAYTVSDKWEGLSDDLNAGLETGVTYCADSLEELADEAGINKDRLLETVETYNEECAAGQDDMFGKDPQFMISVDDGPYWLVVGRSTELCTLGGLKIDTDFEVINTEGEVIPGLYSAGVDCAGSLFNNAYVSFEGVTMGWAMTSGRLAGENAAAYAVE